MPIVQFTSSLKRFYPSLSEMNIDATTVSHLLEKIDEKYPGIKNYIVDDQKALRHHVNIFVNDIMIKDKIHLRDKLNEEDRVFVMQALSGG